MINKFTDTFTKILQRYEELTSKLNAGIHGDEFIQASKEYSELELLVVKIQEYNKAISEFEGIKEMALEEDIDDATKVLIGDELLRLENHIPELERAVKIGLLPKDVMDAKNAIIEVRAGTGGEEASLFAADLFQMYHRYAELNGWKFEILSISDTLIGGYKEASALVKGKGVFAKFKFESGVHRVQRVPETESGGRLHTSAATVAILPEAEDIDLHIEDKDLKIDTYRASGAGGQHVNTTDSAVRITHLPTGIVVALQDEKSQHKNKAKALKILRARVYDAEQKKKDLQRALARKDQVGSGDRSERIRTYNVPQNRVTDHRINLTLYKLDSVLRDGNLNELIDALITHDESQKLGAISSSK